MAELTNRVPQLVKVSGRVWIVSMAVFGATAMIVSSTVTTKDLTTLQTAAWFAFPFSWLIVVLSSVIAVSVALMLGNAVSLAVAVPLTAALFAGAAWLQIRIVRWLIAGGRWLLNGYRPRQ